MLASLLARYSEHGQREADRYAAWLAALQQLRGDWASGKRPGARQLLDYLKDVLEEHRVDALPDLIAEHLRLTWQVANGTTLEVYLTELGREFAELDSPAVVAAELVEDEFLARYQLPHGDAPSLREYEKRFPARPDVIELLARRCLDGGRFVKFHKRGLGACGEVWEAHDHGSPRSKARSPVAIKEPRGSLTDRAEALQRFAEEASVTAALEHPGIVTLRELQPVDGGEPIFLMRLVDGKTFAESSRDFHATTAERTPQEQRLMQDQLLQAFVVVCDAMAYAHARGVLHRDLKPGNIVVESQVPLSHRIGEESGVRAAILDWGMAARVSLASVIGPPSGVIVGTPDYMPPEQADGRADARSDVFGLGAVLYEVLTGQSPHGWSEGSRPADWMCAVREARFQPPRRLCPQTPRALEAICMKALAREPKHRYQSAAELAKDVRRYLTDDPVSAWVEPLWIRAQRWCRGVGRRSNHFSENFQ
jgi:tRNA A-37 threonylcarbamoyl transferase component Bud32